MTRAPPRARWRAVISFAVVVVVVLASSTRVARAQTPPPPPTSAAAPPPPPTPPSPPPPRTHAFLDIPVWDISMDVNSNFFAGTGDDGASTESDALLCRHGCLSHENVVLSFCNERVQYTFCKRGSAETIADGVEDQVSVDLMEASARRQYLNLIRQLTFEPSAGCRATLRRWFCYEYFNRCNVEETRYMPTCTSVCQAVKTSCGEANSAFIECDLEWEEQDFGGSTPLSYFEGGSVNVNGTYVNTLATKGAYIKGQKPNGENGTLVFEANPGRCTGAAGVLYARATTLAIVVVLIVLA
jgi:hypothetical protein